MSKFSPRAIAVIAIVVVTAVMPFVLSGSLLTIGLFAMASAVGALGLTILTGAAGQLSLGHAFFVAVGAYTYSVLAGAIDGSSTTGLGWPPLLAMVGGVLLAGVCGLLFSPVSGRLQGIYLGLASLGLVFVGQHVLINWISVTGGFDGRSVQAFSLFGFTFDNVGDMLVLGVPFESAERRWYLFLLLTVLAVAIAKNILSSDQGRCFRLLRDSTTGARMMGIDVRATRRKAFLVASMYGGMSGVMTALAFERAVPGYYDFHLAVNFLVMITIGGLASVAGGVIGAVIVTAMPLLMSMYAAHLPLVADSPLDDDGLSAVVAASFVYGLLVIVLLLVRSNGGATRLLGRLRRRETAVQ